MKRKQVMLESVPVKCLRPSGSACRYFPISTEELSKQSLALTSLMLAVQYGYLEIVKYHIENSSRYAYNDCFGPLRRNLLHLAACSRKIEIIEYVISNKLADLYSRDELRNLPIDLADAGGKILIQREMNWMRRRSFIFFLKFSKRSTMNSNIARVLCIEFL